MRHPCHILFVRSKLSSPVHIQGEGTTQGGENQGAGLVGAHFRSFLLHCVAHRSQEMRVENISEGKEEPPWRRFQLRLNSGGIVLSSCEVI